MRFLSLFAGIGAFDLGCERAGWTCAGTSGKNRAQLNPRWVAQLMGLPADWLDGVEHP